MDPTDGPIVAAVALLALIGGLWLLARGVGGYRLAGRITDTSTSTISALAVGEVRVSGVIEAAELTLVSLLQSKPCVYFRSSVDVGDDNAGAEDLVEERSVGFRVRDESGSVRIFPRGARIDAPERWHEQDSPMGDLPTALDWRFEGPFAVAGPDRDEAIAALLQVQGPQGADGFRSAPSGSGRRTYRERRLELGDIVTIIGHALPFGDLHDPTDADVGGGDGAVTADDLEVAADLARARADGTLLDDPEDAWGNAAIPGFGIGRPVRAPELDPAANVLPIATAAEAEHVERTFAIEPDALILARTDDGPLLVTYGTPAAAADRHATQFLIGLLGAVMAIAAAVVLALQLDGGLAT